MIKRKMKGFTLVETVIVVAVIAILSSILIPTFGNVIKDANETKYKSEAANAVREYHLNIDKTEYKTALVLYFKDGKTGSIETATRAYLANEANIGDCLTADSAITSLALFFSEVGADNTVTLNGDNSETIAEAYDNTTGKLTQFTNETLYWISDNVALAILTK